MRIARALVLILALAPLPALAMGPSTSATSLADPDYAAAVKLIKEWKYEDAIPLLGKVAKADPNNADAFNQLGYVHRKLGRLPDAATFYNTALRLDPEHRGALEYQGELFLMQDDLKSAEANLAKLDKLCTFGCEEFTELKTAVAEYKKRKGLAG